LERIVRWDRGNRYGGVEDRRGMRGGGVVGGGGIGLIAVALAGYFLFGINPLTILEVGNQVVPTTQEPGAVGTPGDQAGAFVDTILSSTSDVWSGELQGYRPPTLVLYDQATGTQCGTGQAAMGPFYCPLDRQIYLDLQFFQELDSRFGAPGDFAQAYVIAHEVGHHVQQLMGTAEQVRRAQGQAGGRAEANRYSVALELQADCYAGVWAARAEAVSQGAVALDPGDLEEGLAAASAVGDDTLQKQTHGRVVPDSFTHGSAEQRREWLLKGFMGQNPQACDTFGNVR
jgi:predicted metalloprotease